MSECPIFDETRAALDVKALQQYQLPDVFGDRRRGVAARAFLARDRRRGWTQRGWLVLAGVAAVCGLLTLLVVTL